MTATLSDRSLRSLSDRYAVWVRRRPRLLDRYAARPFHCPTATRCPTEMPSLLNQSDNEVVG